MRVIYFLVFAFSLVGCRSANYHLNKAIEKGATFDNKTITVFVGDTITKDGKDSIVYREIDIECPELEVPKTRWEIRFDNNRFNDSLDHIRKMFNDSLDNSIKSMKLDNKIKSDSLKTSRKVNKDNQKTKRTESRKSLWWLFMIIGSFITLILVYLYKRFKKIIFPEN